MSDLAGKPTDAFDPYHKWLGIRAAERPINHYRLLGLTTYEDDGDVIADAADRQMAHVRNYQTGKHSELSQRILNELSSAKLCLLNKAKKQAYDAALKAGEAAGAAPPAAAPLPAPPVPPVADLLAPSEPPQTAGRDVWSAGAKTPERPAVKPRPVSAAPAPISSPASPPAAGGLPMPLIYGGGALAGVVVLGVVAMLMFGRGNAPPPVAVNTNPPPVTPINTPDTPPVVTPTTPPVDTPVTLTPVTPTPVTPVIPPPDTPKPTITPIAVTPETPRPTLPIITPTPPDELPKVISKLIDSPPGLVWSMPHASTVGSVAVTPDGRRAITSGAHRTIGVWDLEQGREIHSMSGNQDMCWGVAISADGRRGVSAGFDSVVRVWDLEAGKKLRELPGHTGRVIKLALSRDGRRILSPGFDGTVRYWDADTGQLIHKLEGHKNKAIAAAITPDGKRGLSGGGEPFSGRTDQDCALKIWNLETGALETELAGHSLSIDCLTVSVDGRYALTGGWDRTARLWDLQKLKEVRTFTGHDQPVKGVAIAPDLKWVYTGSSDGTVRVWDFSSGSELLRVPHANCECIAVAADRRVILSGGMDSACRVWRLPDVPDGESFVGGPPVVALRPVTPPITPTVTPTVTPETPAVVTPKVAQPPAKKLPVPDTAALAAARKTIKEVFADEFKTRKADEKVALARKLYRESLGSKDDEAARYALLDEAFNAASDGGDAMVAWQAAEGLDQYFEVDVIALKKNALSDAARLTRTPPRTLVQMYQALVEQAVQRDEHDAASALVTAGISAARKAKDEDAATSLQARGKEVRDLRGEFIKVKLAREKLAESPDDAEANLLAGKYLCLIQNKWDEGLPLLGKGSEGYRDLMKQEQGRPRTVDARIALGDAWWNEAEKDRTAFKAGLQRRAVFWYEQASPFATGLARSRLQKRIADTPKLASVSSFGGFAPPSDQQGPPPVALNVNQPPNGRPNQIVAGGTAGERAAAETAFRLNGYVLIHEGQGNRHVGNAANLPANFRLHTVCFQSQQMTDGDLAVFKGVPHLQTVRLLNAHRLTEDGLGALAGLTEMVSLDVSCSNLTDDSMLIFSRMPNLKSVSFFSQRLTGRGLAALSGAQGLQTLDLRGGATDAVITAARQFPRLTRLAVQGEQLTGSNISELAGLPLRNVSLGGPQVSDAACAGLARLPALQDLDLLSTGVTDAGLAQLGNLQQLTSLNISNGNSGGSARSSITDEGIAAAVKNLRLQSLTITYVNQFTGQALSALAARNTLTYLNVSHCPAFADAALMNLKGATNLNSLYFHQVNITDAGIAHLKGLPLNTITLYETPVTDACLQTLSTLPRLKNVNFDRTRVTPAAIEQLRVLLRNNPN